LLMAVEKRNQTERKKKNKTKHICSILIIMYSKVYDNIHTLLYTYI